MSNLLRRLNRKKYSVAVRDTVADQIEELNNIINACNAILK